MNVVFTGAPATVCGMVNMKHRHSFRFTDVKIRRHMLNEENAIPKPAPLKKAAYHCIFF